MKDFKLRFTFCDDDNSELIASCSGKDLEKAVLAMYGG